MKKIILTLTIGIAVGFSLNKLLDDTFDSTETRSADQPLYWVAPMDDNYRRDKPGKSPMGMDLVPVYKDSAAVNNGADNKGESSGGTSDKNSGVITIAPHIVNNLGVRTAPVTSGLVSQIINTTGFVQYDQEKWVHIHPRVEGWVEKLFIKAEGETVQSGEPLYTLYSPQLVNAQEELVIALNRNNNSLITAAKTRLAALHVPNQVIKKLVKTKKVAQNVTFYAPQSGVINKLKIREGFFVSPSNTLMSIAQPEHVWVEADILANESSAIKLNQPVDITVDYFPGKKWQGNIDYIYPSLEQVTRTLRARINIHNPDLVLKPNMFANIRIDASHSTKAANLKQTTLATGATVAKSETQSLLVPSESVIRTGNQNRVVLALGDGKFKSVEVTLGVISDDKTQILEGLSLGDIVVTSAQFLLDSESNVKSDFKRISRDTSEHHEHRKHIGNDLEPTSEPELPNNKPPLPSATVNGIINSINSLDRTINISREAIPKWNRGPATMDFLFESDIDISKLSEGQHVNFTFQIRDEFTIVAIKPMNKVEMD